MCQLEKGLGGGFLRGELEDEYLFLNTDQVYSASQKKKKNPPVQRETTSYNTKARKNHHGRQKYLT